MTLPAHFGDYWPPDFGWAVSGTHDPMSNPDALVPFSFNGVSFGSMNRAVVGLFTAVLSELVPLIPGGLVTGQCGCYNPRSISASGTRSFHSWGIAIDVNWGSNPMGVAAHPTGEHALPLATSKIASKYGCEWGGDWTDPKDWMHIECHLSPADARSVTAEEDPLADLTASQLDQISEAVWERGLQAADGEKHRAQSWLIQSKRYATAAADRKALAAAVVAALPAGSIDEATVEAALRKVFFDAGQP